MCGGRRPGSSWYPTATAQVPVSGVGQHVVQCFSESNARDGSGTPGVSAMRSFSMSIRVPTISGIAFTAIADRLRCHRVQKRIRVPARTVIVRRHHKRVRVRRPAHIKIVHVTKCHPRTIIKHRIVIVTIHRHGKKIRVRRRKTIHVIVLPHPVLKLKRRVAFGHGTTVSGWLGTYDGVALAGQAVEVLSAPDNGGGNFTPVAWATTASNGGWSAQIPAGPSRLIEADYGGAANVEPSLSGQVTETVPAKVKLLRVVPRRVAWGKNREDHRSAGGRLPALRRRPGTTADRPGLCANDLRRPGARHGQRPVLNHLHVRSGRPARPPLVLVPARHVADGQLSVRALALRQAVRARRRASADPRGPITATNTEDTIGVPVRADDRQLRGRRILQSHGDRHGGARVPFARLGPGQWLRPQYHAGMVDSS